MMADVSEGQKQHLAQVQMVQQQQHQQQPSSQHHHQQQQQQQSQSTTTTTTQQQPQQISESDGQSALTVRLLMQGKEVGSIIGKKGDNIKRFRECSGAKINVSDSSCLDRIVTLAGTLNEVYNAFSLICSKFEEQLLQSNHNNNSGSGIVNNTNSTSPLSAAAANNQSLGGGGGGNNINNNNNNNSLLLGNTTTPSVMDPLFGLPSTGILNSALKQETTLSSKEADMLTMNNNSTSAINNNNINNNNNNLNAPNKNLNATNKSLISSGGNLQQPSVTIRLIIPASQCGSLIGRGGAKIKEIREMTGATIQVAPEVLPSSTERVVTICGNVDSLKSCAYQICMIMVESPPKGYTMPYRPKPAINQMLLAAAATAGQVTPYNLPGQFGLSTHPDVNRLFMANNPLAAAFNPTTANLRAAAASGQAAAALSAVASQSISSTEMVIPNGLIGCVIGKGGSKINEIRQLSGATIKISNSEEGKNRTVTISGSPESINLAQYLITARLVLST